MKCKNETNGAVQCYNQSYIDSYLNTMTLSFAYTNSMFDTENFTNPIENFIDDSLFIILDASRQKSANLFI